MIATYDPLAVLQEQIFYIAQAFLQPEAPIIDLNPGDGDMLARFYEACPSEQLYVLVSPDERTLQRFSSGGVVLMDDDAVLSSAIRGALVLSQFFLQKKSVYERGRYMHRLYEHVIPGGACIVVENVLIESPEISKAITNSRHSLGTYQACTDSLFPATWTERMLGDVGFCVECFYRSGNIAAWLAVREAE